MCGFAGILNNPFSISKIKITAIAEKVSFRGPDSCGIRLYSDEMKPGDAGTNALFFNRLAIMDIDPRSDQPFEDERFTLSFNGEIYNYAELRSILQKIGYQFSTTSDTEVLFYALKEWKTDAVSKLNGMFAFCWIDRQERRFLLARDRMGIKPLYYSQQKKSLAFGSELDSVLRLSENQPDIDTDAIHMYLWMQSIPTPSTIVKGVFKIPPGHYINGTWDDLNCGHTIQPVAFWDAYSPMQGSTISSRPEQLEDVLVNSLSRQLVADVPLGLFLSSGVDSSLLAALVNKHFAQSWTFDFFTVAFGEETTSDESKEAINFIQGFNNASLNSHTLSIDSRFVGDHLDQLYNYFDEPFGDPTSLLNWVISIKAREHVTVALSGDGADELFWGYKRYDQWKNPYLLLLEKIRIDKKMAGLLQPFLPDKYLQAKAQLIFEKDPLYRHFTLFLDPVLRHLRSQPVWEQPIWAVQGVNSIRNRPDMVALLDLKTYLADAMLYKVDRASMAASLEIRVPYLDNIVIDYGLSLPIQYKSNKQFGNKAVLKQLLKQLAPHYDINRPKKGFNFPLDKWLRFDWKENVLSSITPANLTAVGLDPAIYMKIVQQYYAGDKRGSIAVWYLLNLVLWNRKFKNITPLQSS